ncbi:hypothetical protein B0H63DRAFT_565085 [Podospora didyma]|uniref:SMP-30/Gluconolactonase/LRE-like region domain-containing protein n=1 Tax=Podospora didyma TaxID=330526 RepID=A0AAE0K2E4_9PEZI|nr:hypothetical protein B0H63DRAFT_565085 [Podospora didyma]
MCIMKLNKRVVIAIVGLLAPLVQCHHHGCPPFHGGNVVINAYQLYPENMDWDPKLCQAYISILYNASIGVYNPYTNSLTSLSFPGQSFSSQFHIAGVAWDKYTSLISVIVTQGSAFRTLGRNVRGDNWLNRYDPIGRKFLWSANLTTVSRNRYGGFNDLVHDKDGNIWICGSFPGTLLRVDRSGRKIVEWYVPEVINTTIFGFTGIALAGKTLLVVDESTGSVLKFDTRKKGNPVPLAVTPEMTVERSDAMRLPDKYEGKVLLITDHDRGVLVLRSKDGWKTAEYLGLVPSDPTLPPGALTAAVSQIGQRICMVPNWFFDSKVPAGGLAGNRSTFYLVDITGQVDELLK